MIYMTFTTTLESRDCYLFSIHEEIKVGKGELHKRYSPCSGKLRFEFVSILCIASYIYVYLHTYIFTYICLYTYYVYIHTYTHTHTHISSLNLYLISSEPTVTIFSLSWDCNDLSHRLTLFLAHWIQVKVILEKMQMIWKCHIKEMILRGEKGLSVQGTL